MHVRHLTLGKLIQILQKQDPDLVVSVGFHRPHSYCGIHQDLAFELKHGVSVKRMLAEAEGAVGRTFDGWKGWEFRMTEHTYVWIVNEEGRSEGETMGTVLLAYMLAGGPIPPRVDEMIEP
jgi:hypothetical protein